MKKFIVDRIAEEFMSVYPEKAGRNPETVRGEKIQEENLKQQNLELNH